MRAGPSQRMGDTAVLARIEVLQEQCEYYTKRIEVERRRAEELDKKLKISTSKLEKVRLDLSKMESRDELAAGKRRLANVEHRLDKMSVRLNQALNRNKQLKSHIEDLRREKMQREAIKSKLDRVVNDTKREMIRVIQESQQHADARDKAERQAVVLEATIKAEVAEFEDAFQKRMGNLERERSKAAGAGGGEGDGDDASSAGGGADRPDSPFKGEMTIEQEKELKHKSTKAIWEVVKREIDLKKQDEQLKGFEDAFATIKMHTGIETIDAMVQEFCDTEDQNFSLITIINGLNKEVEQLEVQNSEMEAKLQAAKGQGDVTETNRNKIFGALEEQIRAAEKKGRWYNHKHDEALKALSSVKGGLMGLFQKVGCKDESTSENVAATGITDGNVMEVLGIIEQRIAEIVQMNELSLGKAVKRSSRPAVSRSERQHAAMLPSTLSSDDDDDDDDEGPARRPLSLAELKAKTATMLSRKIAHGTVTLPSTNGRGMVSPP